jgi:hypothetical protein
MNDKQKTQMSEKEEKEWGMDEKMDEKTQEKQMGKRWEEKWSRDPLSSIIWAGILIWAGVFFLIWNMGFLEDISLPGNAGPWSYVIAGAGSLLLVEVLIRLTVPAYSGPIGASLILGVLLFGGGLEDITNSDLIWPLIIIVVGLWIIVRGARKQT